MNENAGLTPGERFRTPQGLCQIITTAKYSPTGEQIVVYQLLFGNYGIFARPLSEFTDESPASPDTAGTPGVYEAKETKQPEPETAPEDQYMEASGGEGGADTSLLMEFLEADSYTDKLTLLQDKKKYLTEGILDSMAVALDLAQNDGDFEQKFDELRRCLKTLEKYECSRLR